MIASMSSISSSVRWVYVSLHQNCLCETAGHLQSVFLCKVRTEDIADQLIVQEQT